MNQINHPIQPAALPTGVGTPLRLIRTNRHLAKQPQPAAWRLRLPAGKEPR